MCPQLCYSLLRNNMALILNSNPLDCSFTFFFCLDEWITRTDKRKQNLCNWFNSKVFQTRQNCADDGLVDEIVQNVKEMLDFPPERDLEQRVSVYMVMHVWYTWWCEVQKERKQNRRHTQTEALGTFLPLLAEAPIQQSQDKADENGLDRLQYGWLEEGRDITRINQQKLDVTGWRANWKTDRDSDGT